MGDSRSAAYDDEIEQAAIASQIEHSTFLSTLEQAWLTIRRFEEEAALTKNQFKALSTIRSEIVSAAADGYEHSMNSYKLGDVFEEHFKLEQRKNNLTSW